MKKKFRPQINCFDKLKTQNWHFLKTFSLLFLFLCDYYSKWCYCQMVMINSVALNVVSKYAFLPLRWSKYDLF